MREERKRFVKKKMKRLTKWILWIFGILAGLILVFYILLHLCPLKIVDDSYKV